MTEIREEEHEEFKTSSFLTFTEPGTIGREGFSFRRRQQQFSQRPIDCLFIDDNKSNDITSEICLVKAQRVGK